MIEIQKLLEHEVLNLQKKVLIFFYKKFYKPRKTYRQFLRLFNINFDYQNLH